MPPRLLVLSNGHGEDLIAQRLIAALRLRRPDLAVAVLPLVGEGTTFTIDEREGLLQRVGPRRFLPSGGFSNQSLRGMVGDLAAGLPALTWQQWRLVRAWGRSEQPILAVGDLLPLLLAWGSGSRFGFVGTPKSDHTWATLPPPGWGASPLADHWHRCKGSEWDPWEWALMTSPRCRLVAVRDRLTARGLRRHGVEALAPGNPMMDGFTRQPPPPALSCRRRVLLLAGSRMPEALGNLRRLLTALPGHMDPAAASDLPLTVLVAVGSRPTPDEVAPLLTKAGCHPVAPPPETGATHAWQRQGLQVLFGPGCFTAWAPWAEVGLATAGTATEQLVGLGVPALSLPGPGPQFKAGFARRQCRLLGGAVEPCRNATELQRRLLTLLADGPARQRLGRIGRRRMGPAGGSQRLANLIAERLLGGSGG